jgi:hypothetical protein
MPRGNGDGEIWIRCAAADIGVDAFAPAVQSRRAGIDSERAKVADSDSELRARLAKLEALFRRAGTAGERAAAQAAIGRIQDRLETKSEAAAVELKFSFPDMWSVRLFVAVCRKHGVRPYRFPRQRRTTVMVRAARRRFDAEIWPEFSDLHTELQIYIAETVDHLIHSAMHSDGDDSGLETPQLT